MLKTKPDPDQIPTEDFCIAPFTSIVQDSIGRSGPCPYQSGCWELSKVPITERWTSKEVDTTRDKYLNGKPVKECERCLLEEKQGFHSHRMVENANARYTFEELKSGEYRKGPKVMVIRTSNKCNLACRTCHAVDSSMFKNEGDFYAQNYNDAGNRYIEIDERKEFSEEEMHSFGSYFVNLEGLHFYGGEPMLNQTHHALFERVIKEGKPSQLFVLYCTNASIYPSPERQRLWSQFQTIQLNFSIDGINAGFEYMRYPAKWDKVHKNLLRYKDELPTTVNANIVCTVNITVSSINIYDLPEIYDYLNSLFPGKIRVTTVHDPVYFSVKNLHSEVKKAVTSKLTSSNHASEFQGLVQYMNSEPADPFQWREFVLWNAKMDAYRNQKFSDAFPEYFEILSPYYSETLGDFKLVKR